jgi:hypothetical protein
MPQEDPPMTPLEIHHYTSYLVLCTTLAFTFLLLYFGNGWHR